MWRCPQRAYTFWSHPIETSLRTHSCSEMTSLHRPRQLSTLSLCLLSSSFHSDVAGAPTLLAAQRCAVLKRWPCAALFTIPLVFSSHGPKVCAKRTGAAASVACWRRERRAQAGRGVRASRSDTRAASYAFECMHMHICTRRKLRVLAVLNTCCVAV